MPAAGPLFSIVTPVYDPPLDVLRDTIRSVISQTWTDWEWILVDDCSRNQRVRDLLHWAGGRDQRIHIVERESNGHIAKASNDGLQEATGEFIALLDHDDLLTSDALQRVAAAIAHDDQIDYLYSDEDKIRPDGSLYDIFRKPDWSPERLLGQMYTSHLSVLRRSVVMDVGGFRDGFEGSQDHDLALRVSEQARRVHHIAEVLYHWRVVPGSAAGDPNAKPYAISAGVKSVRDAMGRRGISGEVSAIAGYPGHYRMERHAPPERFVSLVIPTRGQQGIVWGQWRCFVVEAVRSALARTDHRVIEVVVVFDKLTPVAVLDELRELCGDRLILVPYDEPFNFSKKINLGVLASHGDRVVLLNDDIHARSDRWLENLIAPLEDPEIGMTGAKLYFADTTIQHAGHSYNRGEHFHPYRGALGDSPGRMGDLLINREVSGVTGACAAIRRDVFDEVGGLTENLPVNFNDVDLSYKVANAGYRILWIASSELFHFESKSRSPDVEPWEALLIRARWGNPDVDPYLPDA